MGTQRLSAPVLPRPGIRWRRRASAWQALPFAAGGLIALGGPPLGGKSLLAARLAECLPRVVKLEATDDLSRAAPFWLPEGPAGPVVSPPTAALLALAERIWNERVVGPPPLILVVARFATPLERRRAKRVARRMGQRFLLVEALSRDDQALRRIPMSFLGKQELRQRLRRYEEAVRRYQPVGRAEALFLPALRLTRVQSRLNEQVDRVLARWQMT